MRATSGAQKQGDTVADRDSVGGRVLASKVLAAVAALLIFAVGTTITCINWLYSARDAISERASDAADKAAKDAQSAIDRQSIDLRTQIEVMRYELIREHLRSKTFRDQRSRNDAVNDALGKYEREKTKPGADSESALRTVLDSL